MMKKLLGLGFLFACMGTVVIAVTDADRAARQAILQSIRNRVYIQTLPNGMTVICYCTPNTNKVAVGALVGVGCRHEQADEWGIAHILEHMWFKGTPSRPEGFQDSLFKRHGIVFGRDANAHTWYDHTYYYTISDTENWRVFGDVYVDCLQNLALTPASLTSELGAVSQEVKLSAYDQATLDFMDFLPFNHPYSHSGIGYKEEIFTYTPEQVRQFYEKYYTPDRITFMVCGNVDPASVFNYAATAFAGFNRPNTVVEKPAATSLPFYAGFSTVTKTVYHSQLDRIYSYVWLGAPQNTVDAAALEYIAFALERRLSQNLVDQQGHCLAVECKNYPFDHVGQFMIRLKPKASAYALDYDAIIAAEIADITANGLRDDEMAAMYQYSLDDLTAAAESPTVLIRRLAFSVCIHTDIFTQYCMQDELLQQVSPDAIKSAAYTYLRPILMGKEIKLPIPESERAAWQELQKAVVAHDQALLATRTRTDVTSAITAGLELPEPEPLAERPALEFVPLILSNGMTVYFRQEPVSPRCAFSLLINNDEAVALSVDANRKAFAKGNWDALLLHGTDTYSKKEFDDLCDSLGIKIAGIQSYSPQKPYSVTGLGLVSLGYHFEEGLRLLRLALDKPRLPEEILARKKAEAVEVIIQSKNDLNYQLNQYLTRTLYKDCAWKFGEQDTLNNIAATTMDDIKAMISLLRDPSKVVGVMTGNFDITKAQMLAEKYFGSLVDKSPITVNPIHVPNLDAVVSGHVEVANEQCYVFGTRITCVDSDDTLALEVLEGYFKKAAWNIRERTGLFYAGVGDIAAGTSLLPGRIRLIAMAVPGNVAPILVEFHRLVSSIYQNGVDDQTVQTLKNEVLHLRNKYTHTPNSVVNVAADAIEFGRSLDYARRFDERIAQVTTEQVNAVIKKYFDPSTWSFITVGQLPAGA